jgi:putative acetyltransferase
MIIREDDLSGPEIKALLEAHLDLMRSNSPPESVHALDLDALRAPEVTFWTLWEDAELLGCGALKQLDPAHGEIKSMHTAEIARGRGVGRRMVEHILAEARRRGYRRLSLETGATEDFAAARGLYSGFGFTTCGPFADYVPDPFSAFMSLALEEGEMNGEQITRL